MNSFDGVGDRSRIRFPERRTPVPPGYTLERQTHETVVAVSTGLQNEL
jgi:hypothetical protein